jgi:hypothetical protein
MSDKDLQALEKRVTWLEKHLVSAEQVPYDLTGKLETSLRKLISDLDARVKALEK